MIALKRLVSVFLLALSLCLLSAGCGSDDNNSLSELKVYCFQAGKADAFLFYTENSAVLIDTGESGFGKTITKKCGELGIDTLDYLIVTHFDKDHVGGAKKVLEDLEVKNVLQSNYPKSSSEYSKYLSQLEAKKLTSVTVRDEMTFSLDGVKYTVNPPEKEVYDDSPSNNSSLIVVTEHEACRMLFLGDAEDKRLSEYLEVSEGRCGLVKLPHHGRWQSSLNELAEKASPEYAVITSSDKEPEDNKTIDLLEKSSIKAYLTRINPVIITDDGKKISVGYDG